MQPNLIQPSRCILTIQIQWISQMLIRTLLRIRYLAKTTTRILLPANVYLMQIEPSRSTGLRLIRQLQGVKQIKLSAVPQYGTQVVAG
ncbi:hypothetical protein PPL19_12313 [Pseudomonas psychrotolerans L19]|nr:hypothetical protein PPL19_12313 [Pseudomonas psychrotolerans L19]